MKQDESVRAEIHYALDSLVRPAPELARKAMARVRSDAHRATRGNRLRRLVQAAGVLAAALIIAIVGIAIHQATRPGRAPIIGPSAFPAVVPSGPGGQIACLQGAGLTGFDSSGHVVATIEAPSALRSADGNELYAISGGFVDVYSASSGKLERTIARRGSGNTAALSPEGRYLVILGGNSSTVEVVDLPAGRSVTSTQLGTPFGDSGLMIVLVSPQASRIFAFTNFWQYASVAVIGFDGSTLRINAQVTDGQQGHSLPNCNGMAPQNSVGSLPERLLPDGKTMVSFCPGNGLTSWVDLDRLTVVARVQVADRNPFWLSPVFSPDGSMLYVQEPGTGRITVVDLQARKIVRSAIVNAPTALNPVRWLADRLFPPAFAGGIPRTAVLSLDGAYLYVTGGFGRPIGIGLVRVSDFRVSGQWSLEGGGSLWLSGDGRTLYVLDNGGGNLSILNVATGSVIKVKLFGPGYVFLALTI
jgi:DNA-binding beta-propeller fold protein YncE